MKRESIIGIDQSNQTHKGLNKNIVFQQLKVCS